MHTNKTNNQQTENGSSVGDSDDAFVTREQIMPSHQHSEGGHRKGTTSAFFLNAQWALRATLHSPEDKLQAAACERMMRLQVVDIVKSCQVGALFRWKDTDIARICDEEMATRGDEPVRAFDGVQTDEAYRGFTGEDYLPGSVDWSDELLGLELEKGRDWSKLTGPRPYSPPGVRKATFGAFCRNYAIARSQSQPETVDTKAKQMMREYLGGVIKLGYFNWFECTDKWAQDMVLDEIENQQERS